jgi:hypothetical protein
MLIWKTIEVMAETHRGQYLMRFIHDDSEYDGLGWATFHTHGGGYCFEVGPAGFGTEREIVAACDAHAASQPDHAPMRGWPADAELEAP